MAFEISDRPSVDPDVVIGPTWDQCPEEWRQDPAAAVTAVPETPVVTQLFDKVRVTAALALNAAAGHPVVRNW